MLEEWKKAADCSGRSYDEIWWFHSATLYLQYVARLFLMKFEIMQRVALMTR